MSVSEGREDLEGSSLSSGLLNISGEVRGAITPAGDSDWFQTWLVSGVRYLFTLSDPTFDGVFIVRDSFGDEVVTVPANGPALDSQLSFTPTATGAYSVDVQSTRVTGVAEGAYRLTVSASASDDLRADTTSTSLLGVGQPRGGSIELGGDADWHLFSMLAGRSYQVTISGALVDPSLRLFDDQGRDLDVTGAGTLTFTAQTSDRRYVEVSSGTPSVVGPYSLLVREVPTIRVADVQAAEGQSGSTRLTFTLSLSSPSPLDVTLRVRTADLTAREGVDYTGVDRTVVIPAGQTSIPFTVNANGNTDFQPHRAFKLLLSDAVNAGPGPSAVGVLLDDDAPAALKLPTDSLLGYQWYLYQVQALQAWPLATGQGVKVGVFDQGVDPAQPDLRGNAGLALGVNAATLAKGGAPQTASDQHGTWVAGVLGAARDGAGLVGAAYGASLVPIYSTLNTGTQYLAEVANAFRFAQSLDVLNNSWGFGSQLATGSNWAFYDNARNPVFAPAFAALKDLADKGRGGLGTVVVQSAGNGSSFGDDTNLHNFQNSRHVITVGATDYLGQASAFSTSGASILVSAPGGDGAEGYTGILTTDRSGTAGSSSGDTAWVDGTSFAAPIVSGVVAMMLEANPRLGYRDVQQILAYTARKIDVAVGDWDENGASNWNGGGLHYNVVVHATGFGQVDALAAVRLAAAWTGTPQTSANAVEFSAGRIVNEVIPDNAESGLVSEVTIAQNMVVERAEVAVRILHNYIGDLTVVLVSPNQTFSVLLVRPGQGALSELGSSQKDIDFTFSTVLNWGENAQGNWSLRVFDSEGGDEGTLVSWNLTLIGRSESADDTYVYTSEYPALVSQDAARGVLNDSDGGHNTLNAAALGHDNTIDLSGRSATLLDGAELRIAAGTVIGTAIGGDGHDVLTAADSGSVLRGMRGNDRLLGGSGNDTLNGDGGLDFAVERVARAQAAVQKTASGWQLSGPAIGNDSLAGIERVQFNDQALALDLDGNAGSVARLLATLFGKESVQNPAFVGIGLYFADAGMAYADLMKLALDARLGAGASHGAVVDLLYANAVGVLPSAADRSLFVSLLDSGSYTPASMAVVVAETDLIAANIQLAGLAQTGLVYAPYTG